MDQHYNNGTFFENGRKVIFRLTSGSNTVAGNLTYTAPNKYSYLLKTPITITSDDIEIGVISLQYTNSTPNVSSLLNNQTYQYAIPSGASTYTTRTITMPTGFYSYGSPTTTNDIYGYLQSQMYLNGDYVLDSNGNPVYFIAEELNVPLYALTFTLTVVAVPAGGSNPNSVYATSGNTCKLIIPSSNIQQFFGISAGTYGAYTQTTYINSDLTPELNQVSEVAIQAPNLVNNYNVGEGIFDLFSFPIANYQYGAQVVPAIYNIEYIPMRQQNFVSFDFYLVDQNGNALQIVDPTLFCLNFKMRKRGLNVEE